MAVHASVATLTDCKCLFYMCLMLLVSSFLFMLDVIDVIGVS